MVAKVISGREVAEIILTTDLKNKVLELNKLDALITPARLV